MFGALRRCPAYLPRSTALLASSSHAIRTPISQSRSVLRVVNPSLTKSIIASYHQSTKWQQAAAAQQVAEPVQEDLITEFGELSRRKLVHPNIIDVITKQMKISSMTDVQSRTINEGLSGADIIAQAKTGTGKTLGFLIPVIQRMINDDPKLGERSRGFKRGRSDDIRAIVISPTRELAEQIAVEAKKITANTGIIVQVAVGGTQKRAMLMQTQRQGCHLMIATPGRLYDILSDPYSGIKAPKLTTLVMDEADRLLDDGFTKEIDEIKKFLPSPEEVDRQTLMFSATVPRDVVNLVRSTLKPGFHFANCVDENEEPTHQRVPQKLVHVQGFENQIPALYELILREHAATKAGEKKPFKAIVYFNSTAEVTLAASLFFKLAGGFKRDKPLSGMTAFEIHSKLTQAQRTKSADSFRMAKSGILFSSDVTARGMDFPNVTHVIQIGLPKERDTYIHRIGRTGRAGKEGEGWLILAPLEFQEVRKRLRGMPLREENSLESAMVDLKEVSSMPEDVANILTEVRQAYEKVSPNQLDDAFRGLFGAFQWFGNKHELLDAANRLATIGWGMPEPPMPPSSLYAGGGRRSFGGSNRGSGRDFGGGARQESRNSFNRNSRGGSDRESRGSFDRESRGSFDRNSRGSFDRNSRGRSEGYSRGGSDNRRSSGGFNDRPRGGRSDRSSNDLY